MLHEHYTIKPLSTMTVAVCTAMLLACNPTQQANTTGSAEPSSPRHTAVITDEDSESKTTDAPAPVESIKSAGDAFKRERIATQRQSMPLTEQAVLYGNNGASNARHIRPVSEELNRENFAHYDDAGVRARRRESGFDI